MNSFWLEYNQNGGVQEFTFEGSSVTIGRDKSSDFVLDHPTVSRQHAVIRREAPGHFVLRVLSRGGLTAIDGNQAQGEVTLHDGANINLGKLTFRFRSDDAPSQPQHNLGGGSRGGPGTPQNRGGRQGFQSGGSGGFQVPGSSSGAASAGGSTASGFGSTSGGAGGSPDSGFGPQSNQANKMDGFAQSSRGFQAGGPQGASEPGPAESENGPDGSVGDEQSGGEGPDIVSWDDIASSEEAMKDADPQDRAQSIFERMEEGQKKQEETRPGLIIVAGLAIMGLMGYIFFGDVAGGGGGGDDDGEISGSKELKVEVDCLGNADCIKKAKSSYKVGTEKLQKSGAAISNRFQGYKSLLEAEKYLEEAGVSEPPPSMKELESRKTAAKEDLDGLFRNFRVAYHQAESAKNYERMAQTLSTIRSYFPDKNSYQYRWALKEERSMKQDGVYPAKGF